MNTGQRAWAAALARQRAAARRNRWKTRQVITGIRIPAPEPENGGKLSLVYGGHESHPDNGQSIAVTESSCDTDNMKQEEENDGRRGDSHAI